MEIPSTELGSVELGARVAADPAGVASAPAPGAAVSDATAVADAPIALAAADSGDLVGALGDGRSRSALTGATNPSAPKAIAPAPTSPRTRSSAHAPAPSGKRSRQFGQKPDTGVVTKPHLRQRTGRRARGMRWVCAFAVRSRFRALARSRDLAAPLPLDPARLRREAEGSALARGEVFRALLQ